MKNQFYHFGYLIKYFSLILFFLFFISTINKQKNYLYFGNINNDTSKVELPKKLIITIISEPSCTGCKENLFSFNNDLMKSIKQFTLLKKSKDILQKKIYEEYLINNFKQKNIYYSINDQSIGFLFKDSFYKLNALQNPCQIWIKTTNNKIKIKLIDYQFIFNEMNLSKKYIDSLTLFFNN